MDRLSPHVFQAASGAVVAVQKPLGWTSFDVVNKIRALSGVKKVGHTGTLDPLATGLLLICTGAKTKTVSQYQDLEKVYCGELVLGKTTPSIDLETDFDTESSYDGVTPTALHTVANSFVGCIDQVPPAYSAVKARGVRAYTQARHGQAVRLAPRQVWVKSFSITSIDVPTIGFAITCGKGTYIRSLVRDFGAQLGTGAYLASLCRTRIGHYTLQDAYVIQRAQ
ncbi:MAG: tRNA pseudouridine(55) synthase TruB [Bacteroidota bacterium]